MWSFWRSMCRSVNRITDKRGNGCRPNLADMGKRWPSKWLTFGSDPDPRVYSRSVFFIFFTIFFQIFILHWYHCMVNKDSHCGMWDLWTFVSMLSCNQRPICNTLGEMAGADKIMHSQHFGTYPIDVRIRIRINAKIRIRITDHFWLKFWRWRRFAPSALVCSVPG